MHDIFHIKPLLNATNCLEFVGAANKLTNDIIIFQGDTCVSAKSAIGIVGSIDLNRQAGLIVRDRNNDEIVEETFAEWLI